MLDFFSKDISFCWQFCSWYFFVFLQVLKASKKDVLKTLEELEASEANEVAENDEAEEGGEAEDGDAEEKENEELASDEEVGRNVLAAEVIGFEPETSFR